MEKTAVMDDLQLESPVATAPQAPVMPATGQVTPEQVQALFPNDPTSAAIAQGEEMPKKTVRIGDVMYTDNKGKQYGIKKRIRSHGSWRR